MEVVLLFPGQGSQKPGMGKDLADRFPAARSVFEQVDDALGVGLSKFMFEGPADALTSTENAQPALLAHGAALWTLVREKLAAGTRAAAGHSLGEFTAYFAAGSLSLPDAVRLVRRRGALMREAGIARPGTMAALLGELSSPIEEICRRASADNGQVVPANYNDPLQVVVSGETSAVDRAMELATAAGAKRAVRLSVSGAFHSPLMEPARAGLAAALEDVRFRDPAFPVYSNVTEKPVDREPAARELLLRQLTAPVRWTGIMQALARHYPAATFVELGPGNVLTRLAKRTAPNVTTLTCGTADEIEHLLQQVG